MPRSRGSETPQQPQPQPQRQSPRAPLHLRTTNSESNGVHTHHRSSPKLEDNHRRSPRSPLREFSSCNQKKRVSKVTDLETKLGHVQDELRKLREQLASAEAAKRDAQHELEEAKKKLAPTTPPAAGDQAVEEPHIAAEVHQNTQEKDGKLAAVDTVLELEVDSNSDAMEEKNEGSEVIDGEASKGEAAAAAAAIVEADEAKPKETQEKADMCALEARLEEKVKELERCLAENATLKQQLAEAEASAAAARAREEDTGLKLAHAVEELEASRAKAGQLGEQLEAAEGGKSSLEAEMKRLKVQTEQWRKAADAAAPTRYAQLPLTSEKKIEYFEFMNGSITSTSSGQYLPTSQFLRLDFDGHLRVYEWRPRADTKWAVVKDLLLGWNYSTATRCSYPTVCGRYGICSGNEQCSCPQWDDVGDSNYFVQVDGRRPNSGCKEVAPVSCQSPYNDTKLLRLDDVGYFTYFDQYFSYPGKGVDIRETSESGCRHLCEKNCSCKAAFFSPSAPFGSCFLAFEVFSMMNMQDDDDSWVSRLGYKSTAFIKVQIPVSPAKSARSTDPVNGSAKRPGKPKGAILGSTLGTSFLLIFVVGSVIFIAALKKRYTAAEDEEDDLEQVSGMPRRFSFEELRVATDGFCKKLGRGGFGSVYEGKIEAKTIAVKRLESVGQGRKEFLAEVQTIGNIHHVNLVKLIGYCAEKSCRLLVYEFMPNGSLDKWIFSEEQKASLDWQTRSKIILGVAKGLSYLHEDCTQRIAHLDIKPQNILLDDRFEAKVSDFGLAKLIERDQTHVETRMRGTPGYLAPEWLSSMITEKVDVYSFGVVILEIICGRRNLDRSRPEEDVVLLSLLKRKAEKSELQDFVDECIKNTDFHVDEVMKMIKIAMWCLQDANNRPSMSTVVRILEGGMDIESNLEGMFWTCVVECDAANSGSTAPLLASVLSGPR